MPLSQALPEDETVRSLRRVCDLHFKKGAAWHVGEGVKSLPRGLIREIVGCLPEGVIERIARPTVGADDHRVSVRISPLFNSYVTLAAKYWSGLVIGHNSPLSAPSSDNLSGNANHGPLARGYNAESGL